MDNIKKRLLKDIAKTEYKDKKIVFGEGKENNPIIMLIGEAPGGEEEKLGRPFVGSAGKNLDDFLEKLNLNREDIYISNLVKFRPSKLSEKTNKPINRTPNKKEINFFLPYLKEEIKSISPRIITTLGNTPLNGLMGKITIGSCHGEILEYENFILFPLYHPAAIIYNRKLEDVYYSDLEKLNKLLDKYR